jgi:transposase-like protein
MTAAAGSVAKQLGLGQQTVRRWVIQAQVDAGDRGGRSSEESAEIKQKLRHIDSVAIPLGLVLEVHEVTIE